MAGRSSVVLVHMGVMTIMAIPTSNPLPRKQGASYAKTPHVYDAPRVLGFQLGPPASTTSVSHSKTPIDAWHTLTCLLGIHRY